MNRLALLLVSLLTLWSLNGCGSTGTTDDAASDATGAHGTDSSIGGDSSGQSDVVGVETSGECEVGVGELKTTLGSYIVFAGESVDVHCAFANCNEWNDEGLDFLVGGEAGVDYTRDGTRITLKVPGNYEVACIWKMGDDEVVDETPAQLEVKPGIAARVETTLETHETSAGQKVTVNCEAWDEFDNPLFGNFSLAVNPTNGIDVVGTSVIPFNEGEFQVSCVYNSAHSDDTPETLVVIPAVPVQILTELATPVIMAGGASPLACKALDRWDNPINDFPMSVVVPSEVELQGLSVASQNAGQYEIKCVPQTMDWSLFQISPAILTVDPAPAASLEVTRIPEKPVYQKLDTVLFQVSVRDGFGNLIPDPVLDPVSINPIAGTVQLSQFNYKLVEEGTYLFEFALTENPAIEQEVNIFVDGSGPLLAIDSPGRGATIATDDHQVVISGSVSDDVTGLASFTINDEDATVEEQTFAHALTAEHGVNLVVAEAVDAGGATTRTVRSFAHSTKYYPPVGAAGDPLVSEALLIFLDVLFLDDNDHDYENPDDLATLMEMLLAGLDFDSIMTNPVYDANSYQVFVENFTLDSPIVTLTIVDDGLKLVASIQNMRADVEAVGTCNVLGIDLCPDVSGQLSIDSLDIYAVITLGLDAEHQPKATLADFQLGYSGEDLDLDGIGGLLNPILDAILALFDGQIEDLLKAEIQSLLPGILEDLFAQFQLDQSIAVPALVDGADENTVNFRTRYSRLEVTHDGVELGFDAVVQAAKNVVHTPLGSLGRGDCDDGAEPYILNKGAEVSVGIFDDLLNQLLFAVWWGGSLNLTLDEATLGSAGEELAGYGISDPVIELDFFLAPMLTDCDGDGKLSLGVGDLYVKADFTMLGAPLSISLFASLQSEASIALVNDGTGASFEVTLNSLDSFEYEFVSVTEGFEDLVPIIDELLQGELLTDALDSIIGQSFGGIALPEIDLSGLLPGIPQGTKIKIAPTQLERDRGYTELTGQLE